MSQEYSYAIAVGKKDEERLKVLNNLYNPVSLEFLKDMGIQKGMKVLDLGCGSGIMSSEIAKLISKNGKVIALDINEKQLEIEKKITKIHGAENVEFCYLSAYDFSKLEKNSFDAVFCRFLLMHVQNADLILENIKKILKPNGKLILIETLGDYSITCYPSFKEFEEFIELGVKQFQLQKSDSSIGYKLPEILKSHGFNVSDIRFFHPVLKTPFEKKLFRLDVESLTDAISKEKIESRKKLQTIQKALTRIENNDNYVATYYEVALVGAVKPKDIQK